MLKNIKIDPVLNMQNNLETAADFGENCTLCVLLTGMELMDTTACLGLYAKRRNVLSRESPL
jgi:hypothetical protein